MIIQNRDGSLVKSTEPPQSQHYYAEVPASTIDEQTSLIDRIIQVAFGALGARHLEVRVHPSDDVE